MNIVKHSIITNGYLFNDMAISIFKEYPLDLIQITLDGQKDSHNKLRALKNSMKPTFDVIINNLKSIVTELPTTKIHLRINVDKTNLPDFLSLKNYVNDIIPTPNIHN